MSNYNIDSEDENIDPVDYLKSLDLEDFLNNKTTKDILIIEHYNNFQSKLKPTLKIYMKLTIFLLEIIYFSVKTGTMKMVKLSQS